MKEDTVRLRERLQRVYHEQPGVTVIPSEAPMLEVAVQLSRIADALEILTKVYTEQMK